MSVRIFITKRQWETLRAAGAPQFQKDKAHITVHVDSFKYQYVQDGLLIVCASTSLGRVLGTLDKMSCPLWVAYEPPTNIRMHPGSLKFKCGLNHVEWSLVTQIDRSSGNVQTKGRFLWAVGLVQAHLRLVQALLDEKSKAAAGTGERDTANQVAAEFRSACIYSSPEPYKRVDASSDAIITHPSTKREVGDLEHQLKEIAARETAVIEELEETKKQRDETEKERDAIQKKHDEIRIKYENVEAMVKRWREKKTKIDEDKAAIEAEEKECKELEESLEKALQAIPKQL